MIDEDRRRLLAGAGALAVGAACGCGSSGCQMVSGISATPELSEASYVISGRRLRITLGQIPALDAVGGSVKITNPDLPEPVIVARTREHEYVIAALSCPHFGREIEYVSTDKVFRCVSFGQSEFTESGAKKSGAAKDPLPIFLVSMGKLEKKELVVSFAD